MAEDNRSLRLFVERDSATINTLWNDNIALTTRISARELIDDQVAVLESLEKSDQEHALLLDRISALENLTGTSFGVLGSFTVEHYDDLFARINQNDPPLWETVWENELAAVTQRRISRTLRCCIVL